MIFDYQPAPPSALRAAITEAYLKDEGSCLEELLKQAQLAEGSHERIAEQARQLIVKVRARAHSAGGVDAFMHEYDLSSQEGIAIMCMAEALLRIPDAETAERLIQDKLSKGDWDKHIGHSHSLFVNASTWGLLLTGRLIKFEQQSGDAWLKRLVARTGDQVVRLALKQAMRLLGQRFVMGATIEEALQQSHASAAARYRYSFDMLGEAALSTADAERYFHAYRHAIEKLADDNRHSHNIFEANSISIKLSALHPRYEFAQRRRVMNELVPRIITLAELAWDADINLTIDAEEAERLELSLDVFETIFANKRFKGWEGLGLAVQAYQKRAPYVIDWLVELAQRHSRAIPVRLVKGAYWDSEVKRAQERGLESYPVYTRKPSTDLSYLVCVKKLLQAQRHVFPQFATHNAYTIGTVLELAAGSRHFEFQRLYGMGEELYDEILGNEYYDVRCRVYAPVGSYQDLLPYLVRRLLENGANTSFVNRIVDERIAISSMVADPVKTVETFYPKAHPRIPLPRQLYGNARINSAGINLHDSGSVAKLAEEIAAAAARTWHSAPIIAGASIAGGQEHAVCNPSDRRQIIGYVAHADDAAIEKALQTAHAAAAGWNATPATARADLLNRCADIFEQHRGELIALCIREGGRTIPDASAELREAVDFCRYYGLLARQHFAEPQLLRGPTGERNELSWHGRGVFACISPWNFPLAIFVGQIAAALAAGNTVIAKPAEATSLIAAHAIKLMHAAGIPGEAVQLLPGSGRHIGERLAKDARIAGIAFTGSTQTAQQINRWLAERPGPIVPFIAETGGQNAMIADSSALPEQVVADVVQSAFNSAGQRCSALRVLLVQENIAPRVLELLTGAMAELTIGDPAALATDIGPVISAQASKQLAEHAANMAVAGRLIQEIPLPADLEHGTFFAPCAFLLNDLSVLKHEVFGPILHVLTYPAHKLEQMVDAIRQTGYGLTLGIHSRIDATIDYIRQRLPVGNVYVNRNMIGAVVGVQPFGGEGLSGTGPKAGGPHYLFRFATERTFTINTAAVGGNTTLLVLKED